MKNLILVIAGLSFAATVCAKVIYVDDDASAGGDGLAWASAHRHL